jgi:hypothetical protein
MITPIHRVQLTITPLYLNNFSEIPFNFPSENFSYIKSAARVKKKYITKKETRFVYINTMASSYTHPRLVQTKIKRSTPKDTVIMHFLIHITKITKVKVVATGVDVNRTETHKSIDSGNNKTYTQQTVIPGYISETETRPECTFL